MLWLDNLTAYSLQVAFVALLGALLPALLRLRVPKFVHRYLQVLLGACLLLPLLQPWKPRAEAAGMNLSFDSGGSGSLSSLPAAVAFPSPKIIALVLGIGVAIRLTWLTIGLVRLRVYRAKARPLSDVPPEVKQMQSRIGASARFFISNEIGGPVTFGLCRPVILLPDSFLEMEPHLQEAVACHELLHIRRRDWLFTLGEELVRALLWFHPALWWLVERIRLTREQVVDSLVIEWTRAKRHYVHALLRMAAAPAQVGLAAPSFVRKHHLTERIKLLLQEAPMTKPRFTLSIAAVAITVALAGGFAVWAFPLTTMNRNAPATSDLDRTVVVSAHVNNDGQLEDIRIVRSLDNASDRQALERMRDLRFPQGEASSSRTLVREFSFASPGANPRITRTSFRSEEDKPAEKKSQPSEQMKLYRMADGIDAPQLIKKVEPDYTQEAKDAHIEGTVKVDCVITTEGNVENIRVLQSLDPGLDKNAMDALRQWKFKPGKKDGKSVNVAASVEMNFRLN